GRPPIKNERKIYLNPYKTCFDKSSHKNDYVEKSSLASYTNIKCFIHKQKHIYSELTSPIHKSPART
ncbi:14567_t:CDS:1, partial [Acaulospora colombiana]